LKKDQEWSWTVPCQSAFEHLRSCLSHEPVVLAHPSPTGPIIIDTDASFTALGAVLQQVDDDGNPHVLQYASKTLSAAEQKWPIRELEAYAIVWAVLTFAEYIQGRPVRIRTDHESLKWMWRTDGVSKRIARWALALREYDLEIEYRAGKLQGHVDIFSRDVPTHVLDDMLTDRISLNAKVFAVEAVLQVDPFDRMVPSLEDFQQAYAMDEELQSLPHVTANDGYYFEPSGRLYVPKSLRNRLMYVFHYGRTGAHSGVGRCYSRLREYFYWPGMKNSIQEYNRSCLSCQRRQLPRPLPQLGTLDTDRPFKVVAIDIVGPVQFQRKTWNFLTMVDHYTKFAEIVPLESTTSTAIWRALYLTWFSRYGNPTFLLSDNGANFTSDYISSRCKIAGIHRLYSSPYHPQGNGVVEAFHKFLKRTLSVLAGVTTLEIHSLLATLLAAYRSTPHPSTGYSPFFLLTGTHFVTPGVQDFTAIAEGSFEVARRFVFLENLRQEMLQNALAKMRANPKLNAKDKTVKVGDLVLVPLSTHDQQRIMLHYGSQKLLPRWSEPCQVLLTNGSTATVESIWHRGFTYRRNIGELIPYYANHEDNLVWDQLEVLADYKKHRNPDELEKDVVLRRQLEALRPIDQSAALEALQPPTITVSARDREITPLEIMTRAVGREAAELYFERNGLNDTRKRRRT
jgi:transposase InsO family protein